MNNNLYTNKFFQNQTIGSYSSAKEIVPIVLQVINPKSVVDIGCGTGAWLSVFKKVGVKDILGVDGSYISTQILKIPKKQFLPFDLTKSLKLNRKFDLVVSLEVAEHLPKRYARTFVDSLTNLGPVILFSAAIPYQGGINHLNEQWPQYWEKLFDLNNYIATDCIRARIWNNKKVETAYAQNILIYVERNHLKNYPLLYQELNRTKSLPLAIVHPKIYHYIANRYQRSIKTLAKRLLLEILNRIGLIKL